MKIPIPNAPRLDPYMQRTNARLVRMRNTWRRIPLGETTQKPQFMPEITNDGAKMGRAQKRSAKTKAWTAADICLNTARFLNQIPVPRHTIFAQTSGTSNTNRTVVAECAKVG